MKFNHPSNRNRHVRKVHGKSLVLFECHICPQSTTFNRSDNLNLHLKRIHGIMNDNTSNSELLLECDLCPYKSLTKVSIIRHMKLCHDGNRTVFSCQQCGKPLSSTESLKKHTEAYHLDISKFACRYCQKTLRSDRTLVIHENKCHQRNQRRKAS